MAGGRSASDGQIPPVVRASAGAGAWGRAPAGRGDVLSSTQPPIAVCSSSRGVPGLCGATVSAKKKTVRRGRRTHGLGSSSLRHWGRLDLDLHRACESSRCGDRDMRPRPSSLRLFAPVRVHGAAAPAGRGTCGGAAGGVLSRRTAHGAHRGVFKFARSAVQRHRSLVSSRKKKLFAGVGG